MLRHQRTNQAFSCPVYARWITRTGCLAMLVALIATPLDAANTIDPNTVGATDVVQDPDGTPVTLNNPLADPLNISGGLSVGHTGSGELRIDAGSEVSSVSNFNYIGFDQNAVGVITVADPNSSLSGGTFSSLSVGRAGEGTLNLIGGGTATFNNVNIGDQAGSVGTTLIDGTGSVLTTGLFSGRLRVGHTGTGSLTIQNGGAVTIGPNNSAQTIGSQASGVGTATVTGQNSSWTTTSLEVGLEGTGTLNILDGAAVTGTSALMGRVANSTGTATVDGEGSTWSTVNNFFVGEFGNGTLLIDNGGTVTNNDGFVAPLPGANGSVTVTGSDLNGNASSWNLSGSLDIAGSSSTLAGGAGSLTISNGAAVSNTNAYISRSDTAVGNVTVDGVGSTWTNSDSLYLGGDEDPNTVSGAATLSIANGGAVAVANTTLLRSGSTLNLSSGSLTTGSFESSFTANFEHDGGTLIVNGGSFELGLPSHTISGALDPIVRLDQGATLDLLNIKVGGDNGNGTLEVLNGSQVTSQIASIARNSAANVSAANVTVDGAGSTLEVDLLFAGSSSSSGTFHVNNDGLFKVNDDAIIQDSVSVVMGGGRFEFGDMLIESYRHISGTSGELAGTVRLANFNALSDIDLSLPNIDVSEVTIDNEGLLFGTGVIAQSLDISFFGEVRTLSGEWARFGGSDNSNDGEVNNFGGVVEFTSDFTNRSTGFVAGRGQFIAGGGWTNDGVMAFSGGPAEVLGVVTNTATGQISIGGTSVTTFYDDVTMDASNLNIDVAASGTAVFLGSYNGGNDGTGAVEVLGDLRPGNSPAVVSFGGDLSLGSGSSTLIELGGLLAGEFDAFEVDGDLSIDGDLLVSLLGTFSLEAGMEFLIAEVAGNVSGMFDGLDDGDLVGNFGAADLFIDYSAGDGNDIALFAAAAEPEGDFDFDGDYDGTDFLTWQRGFLATYSASDLADWQSNYGTGSSLAASTAVPEPGSWVLFGIATLLCSGVRQRELPHKSDESTKFASQLPSRRLL